MSIDRIGKGPGAPQPGGAAGVTPASAKRTFSVNEAGSPATPATGAASATSATSPAEQVRRGEISMNDYLDVRVREATQHLQGKLGPNDLSRIQAALREQMSHDPLLQELVQSATGQLPPVDE